MNHAVSTRITLRLVINAIQLATQYTILLPCSFNYKSSYCYIFILSELLVSNFELFEQ